MFKEIITSLGIFVPQLTIWWSVTVPTLNLIATQGFVCYQDSSHDACQLKYVVFVITGILIFDAIQLLVLRLYKSLYNKAMYNTGDSSEPLNPWIRMAYLILSQVLIVVLGLYWVIVPSEYLQTIGFAHAALLLVALPSAFFLKQ